MVSKECPGLSSRLSCGGVFSAATLHMKNGFNSFGSDNVMVTYGLVCVVG